MAETLGGSRGRNDNLGGTKALGLTRNNTGWGGGGGLLDRPATARVSPSPGRLGGMAAVLGGAGYGGTRGRPSSAPRERPGIDRTTLARVRVEENRQLKEAGFWGRDDQAPEALRAPKRDLPAFWSVSAHGQPFNDDRLAAGASNFYRLVKPAGLNASLPDAVGPATMQQAALRKSLETGRRLFSPSDLSPLMPKSLKEAPLLSDAEREYLLNKLTPYQRIHALFHCLDQNPKAKGFYPWPLVILNRDHWADVRTGKTRVRPAKYDESDWNGAPAQRDMLTRLATSELEYMMRRHVKYLSDRECSASRAPSAMERDILRQAFWKVDPQRTGSVSVQQFLQVWQNVLRLFEYEDTWIKAKDVKGKTRPQQVLKPLRTVLLDRNMAAALFVKYGFDKDGLMPYVVFINSLCESPARLLGHEVVLNKSLNGKNGLENDIDVSLCLGNAKIDYRFCKTGVFPPGEFTAKMGKRSFHPPKAHMWLEHVYGYAGMLEYTLQSNLFYTYNTGKDLDTNTAAAVKAQLCAAQGAASEADLRPDQLKKVEFVYYTGSVGVVFDKEKFDAGLPCQRFFFGHNNDIQCLTMHPNRRFVATGQQKCTGKREVPYVCIWDVDHCMQLQRLDHRPDERGVIALCFSGDMIEGKGGDILLTVTSDDKHSIHVWRWLPHPNKYVNAHYIPGWSLGPDKKILPLRPRDDMYFNNREGQNADDSWLNTFPFQADNWQAACEKAAEAAEADAAMEEGRKPANGGKTESDFSRVQAILRASRQPKKLSRPAWMEPDWWAQPVPTPESEPGPCPMWSHLDHPDMRVRAEDADGFYTAMRSVKREEGPVLPGADPEKLRLPHHELDMNGCNGTPPMVYGLVWNPFRQPDGRKGNEFASYGVKHLKVWITDDRGQFVGTQASFGKDRIKDVLSALYVPAMHALRKPGDSCLLTGFESGQLGLWVPPYPTCVGAVYTLTRLIDAHAPGRVLTIDDGVPINNGSQVHGGVRALKMRRVDPKEDATAGADGAADGGYYEVLSGGADGIVKCWRLEEVSGPRPDGTPLKGVRLVRIKDRDPKDGVEKDREFKLQGPLNPFKKEDPPLVVALDCLSSLKREFLAGTNGCDIWEVDNDPRILVEGHENTLDEVATHPELPHIFATACLSGKCRVWDARRRDVLMCADLGYQLKGIAFSQEVLAVKDENGRVIYSGYHLAVSGHGGELTVMRSETLQPLVHLNDVKSKEPIDELKYSPAGGPRLLAAGASDLTIYIYRADKNYQLLSKCTGHSGTVAHIDWSLPIVLPGTPYDGAFVLQSCDTALDLLYWDPQKGKKLPYNMRDAEWHTWTLTVGFDVMGIWPDGSNGTDINSVDRGRLGAPIYDPYEAEYEESTEAAFHLPGEEDSADGVGGAGYLVTADDFSTIKLFNYPIVADDAPYKAFRGHASHVTSVRFAADDRLVVSVGGHDRGIYQWRTCGLASGLPPLPAIYRMLGQASAKAGNREAARVARDEVWRALHSRARAFRAYERLKLFAMRVAVEEKRVASAATAARPQPKLPEQMAWGVIPGTKQFAQVRRPAAEAAGGHEGEAAGGKALAGGEAGTPGTPRVHSSKPSAAPSPQALSRSPSLLGGHRDGGQSIGARSAAHSPEASGQYGESGEVGASRELSGEASAGPGLRGRSSGSGAGLGRPPSARSLAAGGRSPAHQASTPRSGEASAAGSAAATPRSGSLLRGGAAGGAGGVSGKRYGTVDTLPTEESEVADEFEVVDHAEDDFGDD